MAANLFPLGQGNPRFLVQLKPASEEKESAFALSAERQGFQVTELLPPRKAQRDASFGFAEGPETGAWYLAENKQAGTSAWDLAYEQLRSARNQVAYVEPDILQPFVGFERAPVTEDGAFAAAPPCKFRDQNGAVFPTGPGIGWHLEDHYSQLRSARNVVGMNPAFRARIAHLDTGYDPNHASKPPHLLELLGRNFSETDNPGNGNDPGIGGFTTDNTGHGTATLGILAGNRFRFPDGTFDDFLGGAPQAEVIPIRIAGSVVLLRTSAFVLALRYAIEQGCHVVTMSMGGLPSKAWAEAVNRAYEAGICIVSAAGNNMRKLGVNSPQSLVYPARFDRVIAACGVMENRTAYIRENAQSEMAGNYGPGRKMRTAIAAYTPNVFWPEFRCPDIVSMDGQGTSAATPQIAATAALWLMRHSPTFDQKWKRVEAVRHALFTSALKVDPEHFGNGILQARRALDVAAPRVLRKTPEDTVFLPFLRLITGLGVVSQAEEDAMRQTELLQLWQQDAELQKLIPDPDAEPIDKQQVRAFLDCVIEHKAASDELRRYLEKERLPTLTRPATPLSAPAVLAPAPDRPFVEDENRYKPAVRRLRAYSFDPSLSTRTDTRGINEVTLSIRWEKDQLEPGPVGEYIAVIDHDPASDCFYDPVNLNDPYLLAQDGVQPSEGNPHFHQQMAYVVAMRTVEHFEKALGRPAFWASRTLSKEERKLPVAKRMEAEYVRRLRIYPHALRQANAFYSPTRVALLFGYFSDQESASGEEFPGGLVFTCLSHDIIAHETTHALLDGMHRRFREATNVDVSALHEAFADIVALFQHFSIPDVLKHQIARTRGDLSKQNLLGELARQMGRATGKRGALRDAINTPVDPTVLDRLSAPHTRGAILVAAVFDAWLDIYKRRIADLLRLASGGTGRLPEGEIHPDLVNRLANEAASTAEHVLNMCIRALDYCPPVDVTFGEYLRAILTADFDLVREDRRNYRVSFVDAFRRRGIYPSGIRTLSVETLLWNRMPPKAPPQFARIFSSLRRWAADCVYWQRDRRLLFIETGKQRANLHGLISDLIEKDSSFAAELGIDAQIRNDAGRIRFEVHSLRRSERSGPDGQTLPQAIVVLAQCRKVGSVGEKDDCDKDDGDGNGNDDNRVRMRGGATLVFDLEQGCIAYRILKNINSARRLENTIRFLADCADDSLRDTYFGNAMERDEPFAILHGDTF
jgi:hypothetical protein